MTKEADSNDKEADSNDNMTKRQQVWYKGNVRRS
jgi:hypothetical protein